MPGLISTMTKKYPESFRNLSYMTQKFMSFTQILSKKHMANFKVSIQKIMLI